MADCSPRWSQLVVHLAGDVEQGPAVRLPGVLVRAADHMVARSVRPRKRAAVVGAVVAGTVGAEVVLGSHHARVAGPGDAVGIPEQVRAGPAGAMDEGEPRPIGNR